MGVVEGQDDASVIGMAVDLWSVASTPVAVPAGKPTWPSTPMISRGLERNWSHDLSEQAHAEVQRGAREDLTGQHCRQ
jgi:hypothetical protein